MNPSKSAEIKNRHLDFYIGPKEILNKESNSKGVSDQTQSTESISNRVNSPKSKIETNSNSIESPIKKISEEESTKNHDNDSCSHSTQSNHQPENIPEDFRTLDIPPKKLFNTSLLHSFIRYIKTPIGLDAIKLISILVLFHLSLSGHVSQLFNTVMHDDIYAFNSQYLKTASSDSVKTLEVIASIKSILSLLQSMSGGVSFIVDVEVQLGESLSVLSNITDKAWSISLSSVGATETLSLLHHAVYFTMKPLLVTLFLLLGLSIGLKRIVPIVSLRMERLTTLGVFLVVFTHIIVPFSIYTTAKVSQYYLQPQKQALHHQYKGFNDQLPEHKNEGSFKDQVSALRKHFKTNVDQHKEHAKDYSLMAVRHVLYTITEFILLPIVIVIFLSKLLIIMIRKELPAIHHQHLK